jgi:putative glycosyltransferase (TIGR04372 family)
MNVLKRLVKATVFAFSFFVLLVMKLIQPIVKFQLCVVGFHRYGHLALEPEIFLAEQEIMKATNTSRRRVISIWSLGPVAKQSNSFLASKWKEALLVLPSWFVGSLHSVGTIFPLLKLTEPKLSITGSMNGLDKTDSHVSLSAEEMEEGRKRLIEFGINPDEPYVCLIVRDGGHYKSRGDIESTGYELLNFDINDFSGVAEELIDNGFQVIRMGSGSERPFTSKPDGVVDYALSKNRSEFLDVYLAATCEFAVSTQTGPDAVCMLFRRPVLYLDVTRYCQFFFGSKLATWSPVRLQKNGSILNLSEVVKSEIAWFKDPNLFSKNGITQQKSSKSELKELVRSYIRARGSVDEEALSVRSAISRGFGERGRLHFGEVTACLAPDAERILGDWVTR